MSKDNGKIKVDKNSFDKMTVKQKPAAKKKDRDQISNNKLIAWFQRYWYYYKAPVLIGAVVLLFATIFIVDLVTKKEPDMRFSVITRGVVMETDTLEIAANITDYVNDINADGEEMISPQTMQLVENPQSDYELAAHYQIMATLIDETYVAFIVDEGMYEYMMDAEALEKLSYFGLETEEEYRLLLNDTWFMKDAALNDGGPYYLVFKTCNVEFLNDTTIQGMYEMYVDFAEDIIAGEKRVK